MGETRVSISRVVGTRRPVGTAPLLDAALRSQDRRIRVQRIARVADRACAMPPSSIRGPLTGADLARLRTVLAPAETGSFTRTAARGLGIRSAVSARSRRREALPGSPLLARARRRVRLHVGCHLALHLVERFRPRRHRAGSAGRAPGRAPAPPRAARLGRRPRPSRSRPGRPAAPRPRAPLFVSRVRALAAAAAAGFAPDVVDASPREAGQVAAVRAGLGATVLPRRRVPAGLAVLGPGWPPLPVAAIGLPVTARPKAAVEAFARFAEARLAAPSGLAPSGPAPADPTPAPAPGRLSRAPSPGRGSASR